MLFSSFPFLFLFLPVFAVAYALRPSLGWRNIVLFAFSLVFYAWGEPRYVLLMIGSILFNWSLAPRLVPGAKSRKAFLLFGAVVNLGALAVFKYASFLLDIFAEATGRTLHFPRIPLPVGISFYTFQALSYLADVYRGEVAPQRNLVVFGPYLTMFPHLIAGPIVRYQTIAAELMGRHPGLHDIHVGLQRFILGLGKKVLIANTLGAAVDRFLAQGPAIGAIGAWAAFAAYTLQIYFDFSGYSDMAIGLGRLLGFHFLENFNYPYIATSVTEFWRRWHISLSSFFRDYVYIPLGGNRVTRGRWIVNMLIVWGLTGLWHGASWNFVLWGLYYGLLILAERLFLTPLLERLPRVCRHLYLIVAVVIGWVFFRVEGAGEIWKWLEALAGRRGSGNLGYLDLLGLWSLVPWLIVGGIGATPWWREGRALRFLPRAPLLGELGYGALYCVCVVKLASGGFNPFIYFRF